ncbi:hypothetical protein [Sporolactobacillus pectinivorans]|uniref:hypothetical protein n=1 Tax=Sporolactobacillus pectinivorans TaxID=1591408 RepID=UPI000C25B238|nr:hypothetical protein [Sporolactobacillus pectinivorans]
MTFTKPLPEWNAVGTEPPQTKKDAGWAASDKPPADWFNWFFNLVYLALQELQQSGYTKDEITQAITNAINTVVPNSQVSATAVANKLLLLNSSAKLPASITGNADGNAATASKLQTSRTIGLGGDATGSASFDGSANISISAVLTAESVLAKLLTVDGSGSGLDADLLDGHDSSYFLPTAGNAPTASKLATARNIGGVPFDGSSDISLPGVNAAGNQSTSGNAETASKLATARTLSISGDGTTSGSFDGSANLALSFALAASGVTAGTYTKLTVDAKGRVTSGTQLASADIPALDWSKIATGKPTTLSGYGIIDAVSASNLANMQWYDAVLQNGATGTCKYAKGALGVVHLMFNILNWYSGNVLFQLPTGCIPSFNIGTVALNYNLNLGNYNAVGVRINSDGKVYLNALDGTSIGTSSAPTVLTTSFWVGD